MSKKQSNWGLSAMMASAVLFAGMAITVRMAREAGIPGAETTFIRFVSGTFILLGMQRMGIVRMLPRRLGMHVWRGVVGGFAILLYFLSLSSVSGAGKTSLTNSTLLANSYFVFAALFAGVLLRERLRAAVIGAIVLAFIGMVLVASPKLAGVSAGDAYAIAHGVVAGLALVIVRDLRRTESSAAVLLSLCVFGSIIAGIAMIWQPPVMPTPHAWVILAAMILTATSGQLLQAYAMRFMPAGEGGLLSISTVVYSTAAGILFFGDSFTWNIAVGAALVLGSAGYLAFQTGVGKKAGEGAGDNCK